MKKKVKKKRNNPNDATFRNINALKKRVLRLEQWMEALTKDMIGLWNIWKYNKK